ncbi:MAG: hypothetical protein U9O87_05470, partial [Verrucomicrobiota bacterium]|nr:hypothetical protein [Verrucomicrobiota bacterium]
MKSKKTEENMKRFQKFFTLASIVVCLMAVSTYCQEIPHVWWEGENPDSTDFPPVDKHAFRPFGQDQADKLSNGKWLGIHGGGHLGSFAEYQIIVPENGNYSFYSRKFWKHGPFKWRFDDEKWNKVTRDVSLMDGISLRKHVGANWVYLGDVKLSEGEHTFRLELLEDKGAACFDAFLLTQGPFVPRGKLKPGQKSNKSHPGYFAWEPPIDPLSEDSLIDMSFLNESEAGVNGFVRRDGDRFVLGN